MKRHYSILLFLIVSSALSANAFAQNPTLEEADRFFDFAESFDPVLFAPPTETQQLNVAESNWFLRFYSNMGVFVAVNIDGVGPFFAGDVYVLGGPLGDVPVYIDKLSVLLAFIDSVTADDDDDGLVNSADQCPGTPTGEPVNAQGCSASQLDDDADGVSNALDQCPATPAGEEVNGNGCGASQLDDDNDGVSNDIDQCPATLAGVPVNPNGCSAVQMGIVVTLADANKLFDFAQILDSQAFSPPTTTQQATQSGSSWYVRTYTNSGISIKVNIDGTGPFFAGNVYVIGGPFGNQEVFIDTLANLIAFIDSQADDDNDGVANGVDQCPATPTGETVDAQGCSATQGPLAVAAPDAPAFVVGEAGNVMLETTGPGPYAFESIGAPLPEGLTLNAATGAIGGTPTVAALLAGTPAGEWPGIVIRVSNGSEQSSSAPFTIAVMGAPLPTPYAYMAFDASDLDDAFGADGLPTGNVVAGQTGAIGGAVFVGGTNSYIKYPTAFSSQLNGKSGFTIATTLKTTSAGTMLFNLSDQFTNWSRVYLALANGKIELGGRSQNSDVESYRELIGDTVVNDGTFHTVVGVLDLAMDRASIFLDGVPDGTRTMGFGRTTYESFSPADQNVVGHITALADTLQAPNVVHDEVALWDVALNARQAATVAWLLRRGTSLRTWIGF